MSLDPDSSIPNRWRLVLAELELAMAMVALAERSRDPEMTSFGRECALTSYQEAMKQFLGTPLDEAQEREFWNRVAPVRRWLESKRLLKS